MQSNMLLINGFRWLFFLHAVERGCRGHFQPEQGKTSAALERFSRSGGLYVSVLTHPTTGGVTASFASLGDITLAEPGALIGFAGPRVIEQTIGEELPDGFQRSEFQLEHGFVDQVVPRTELKEVLTRILQLHTQGRKCR